MLQKAQYVRSAIYCLKNKPKPVGTSGLIQGAKTLEHLRAICTGGYRLLTSGREGKGMMMLRTLTYAIPGMAFPVPLLLTN